MAETDVASVITPTLTTAVTYAIGPAFEVDAGAQVFNPLYGFRISDPLVLPGTPVTGSVVSWSYTAPAVGSTVTVYTSINNGASWDRAVNGGQVPRLAIGNTTTQQVLTQVVLTRVLATDASPRVQFLLLEVTTDSSTNEYVPICHGMINKVEVTATGGPTGGGSGSSSGGGNGITSTAGGQFGSGISIKLSGVDPSRAISRNVWEQPFSVSSGLTYDVAIVQMVQNRLPSQTAFSVVSTTNLTPLLVYGIQQGGDPWQDIRELAQAIGYEAFFDPTGMFVFRPVPDPTIGIPVWEFSESANPTVVEVKRALADDDTYNFVVVRGESTSTTNPVSGYALDNNPASATYVGGPFGTRSVVLTMQSITTAAQATAAAQAYLLNSLGAAETVTFTCVPMPALEPGDIVTINISDTKATGQYLINSITTPLSPAQAQQIVAFRQSSQL